MPLETYKVREDLKKALPGSYYQVLVALHYMLDALLQNKKFTAKLELAGVGALDDVVLSYPDEQNPQQIFFLQLKHAANNDEVLTESDIRTASGKCEIFKYFDDWYLFIKDRPNFPNALCIYYTNRDFELQLKTGGLVTLTEQGYQFTAAFLAGGKNTLYQQLFDMMKKNSVMCNRQLIDKATSKKISKNPTYQAAKAHYDKGGQPLSDTDAKKFIDQFLKDYYRMMVGQQHVEELEKTVATQVQKYFSDQADSAAIFTALIVDTWQWFRVLEKADIWNEKIFKDKLHNFKNRFITLQQQIGRMHSELTPYRTAQNFKIERKELITLIDQAVKCSEFTMTAFEGERLVGKTTLIAEYIFNHTQLKPGEYLYFSSTKTFLDEYQKLLSIDFLKIFIVDDDEGQHWGFIPTVLEECKNKKKIIFLSWSSCPWRNYYSVQSHTIPVFSKEEILTYLTKTNQLEHVIKIGDKYFYLGVIANSGTGGLFLRMQNPSDLQAICSMATPLKTAHTQNPTDSSYLFNAHTDFQPIPLNAEQVFPLYSLEELYRFRGSKYIQYENDETLQLLITATENTKSFRWLQLESIDLPLDPNISINIKTLLKDKLDSEKEKTDFEKETLVLLIVDKNNNLNNWPVSWKVNLFELAQIIIFSKQTDDKYAKYLFSLTEKEGCCYFEPPMQLEKLKPLPAPTNHITRVVTKKNEVHEDEKTSLIEYLKDNQRKFRSSVIVAQGGAGKSTTLKTLYTQYSQSNALLWGEHYQHLVFVPLNQLIQLPHLFNETNLLNVIFKFLSVSNPVIKQALEKDFVDKKILFLLDGWDELNKKERDTLDSLLNLFERYQHFIVTTRIEDRNNLFFNPVGIYELLPFSPEQVAQCFTAFFKNASNSKLAEEFVKKACEFLEKPINKHTLEVIGLPLQCYLLCEAWWPAFDIICRGIQISMPWEEYPTLTRSQLYQQFLVSRLRKLFFDQFIISKTDALKSPEEICCLGTEYLKILQEAAYLQLFRGKTLQLGNDWFAKQILRLGLIDGNQFAHKTYAEYFSALYLTNLLITNLPEAKRIIAEYRYQIHFILVFEFMAGIVSYGDPIIPTAKAYLRTFWEALLQPPRDCIGIIDKTLIERCYFQSNQEVLVEIFNLSVWPSTLLNQNRPENFSPINSQTSIVNHFTSETSTQNIKFEPLTPPPPPSKPSKLLNTKEKEKETTKWLDYAKEIKALPVEKYSLADKSEALNWLSHTITSTKWFRVKEACVEKISALGILTPDARNILINLLSQNFKHKGAIVKETVVKSLIELRVQLDELQLNENFLKELVLNLLKINSIALWDNFYQAGLEWLKQQKNFLSKIEEILNNVNKEDSLFYYAQYALLEISETRRENHLESILKISYSKDTFYVMKKLLIPIRNFFIQHPSFEKYKAVWINKIYEYAQEVTNTEDKELKNFVSDFVIELTYLEFDPTRMEKFLKLFLKGKRGEWNFWHDDAITPCFSYLAPYFSETCANHLSKYPSLLNNLTSDFIKKLPNENAQKLMIEVCFLIYKEKGKEIQTCNYNVDANRKRYQQEKQHIIELIKILSPSLFLSVVLEKLSQGESALDFLKNYMKQNNYGMTLSLNEIFIYMPGGVLKWKITPEQYVELSKIKNNEMIFPEGLTILAPTRPSSPTEFLIAYPGTFLNRNMRTFSLSAATLSATNEQNTKKRGRESNSDLDREIPSSKR